MTRFAATLTMLAVFGSASAEAQTMVITRDGSRAIGTGPATSFTGEVRVEMLFEAVAPSHASGGSVTKVDTTSLRAVGPRFPAPASDAARAKALNDELGAVAPKFVQLTKDVVFDDLWRRSDLSPRDRSLVTIAALAGMGDDDQLDFYFRLGLDSGLTRLRSRRR